MVTSLWSASSVPFYLFLDQPAEWLRSTSPQEEQWTLALRQSGGIRGIDDTLVIGATGEAVENSTDFGLRSWMITP